MIAKFFALLLLAVTLYGIGIFATPELADTYGNKEWNTKIREYKKSFENFSSG